VSGIAEAGHVHSDLGHDGLGAAAVDAGDGVQQLNLRPERGDRPLDLGGQPSDGLVQVVELGQDLPDEQGVAGSEPAGEGLAELGIFFRSVPLASSARAWGSVVPSTRAPSMARPDAPRICEATEESLMPASCSTLSSRWASLARSWIWALG
jgi:hypothetical protein